MKGLFVSDWLALAKQKKLAIAAVLLGIYYCMMDLSEFCIPVLLWVCTIALLKEKQSPEGNERFFFTLPFTRKEYVAEQYLFTLLMSVVFDVLICLLVFAAGGFHDAAQIAQAGLLSWCFAALLIALMIPCIIRFGKSAYLALSIGMGMLCALFLAAYSAGFLEGWQAFSLKQILWLLPAAVLLLTALSWTLSLAWIRRKSF